MEKSPQSPSPKAKIVLVTGATGFVGRQLVPRLLAKGYSVRTAVRTNSAVCLDGVEKAVIGDLSGSTNWAAALKGVSTIIHLAGKAHTLPRDQDDEADFFRVNYEATKGLAQAAAVAGVESFILISSIFAISGDSKEILSEHSACHPSSIYGQSKLAGEKALIECCRGTQTNWTILRPVVMYGPQSLGNIGKIAKWSRRGWPIPFGNLKQKRSLLFVLNFTDLIMRCINEPKASAQTFVVSDNNDISTSELARCLIEGFGRPKMIFSLPTLLMTLLGFCGDLLEALTRKPMPLNSALISKLLGGVRVDSTFACRQLDWNPPYTAAAGLEWTAKNWDLPIPKYEH